VEGAGSRIDRSSECKEQLPDLLVATRTSNLRRVVGACEGFLACDKELHKG